MPGILPSNPHKQPHPTGWVKTPNNCGKHNKILYARFHPNGKKVLVMACPDCPNGPTFGEHTATEVHDDF